LTERDTVVIVVPQAVADVWNRLPYAEIERLSAAIADLVRRETGGGEAAE